MVGFAAGSEMTEGLRARLGLSGGREAEEDWADGRVKDNFFMFFLSLKGG